jgi:molybdopterin converting factor small subunit
VSIPAALRQFILISPEVDVEATTVDEAVSELDRKFPSLRALIIDENHQIRRYVNMFVNQDDIRSRDRLMTKLEDGDYLHIIPSIAGGD